MDAAAIEEINRTRVAHGMEPLPVPGADGPQFKEREATPGDDDEEPASTLETREAAAYDNFKQLQDAEEAKKRREEKLAAIKKARDAAKRNEVLEGKGLGDMDEEGDVDAKAWLIGNKKRQREIEKARKREEEQAEAQAAAAAAVKYTSRDLAGVKVAHEFSAFEDGDEQILTLKDSNVIGDDDEGDELENIDLREREKLAERLDAKKKKPVYDPHAADEGGEHSLLAQYDEEITGKKTKRFTLDAQGAGPQLSSADGDQPGNRMLQKINLDILKDDVPSSDYLDISEVKVKKPKKKKSKTTRQRPVDDDDIDFSVPQGQSMEIDSGAGFVGRKRKVEESAFADDEDLQATLAAQRRNALKKRKRARPEDIARQLKAEAETPEPENDAGQSEQGGLVIDETSEFLSGLRQDDEEERKPRKSKTPNPDAVTAMETEADDEPMKDAAEVDEEARPRENSTPADTAVGGVIEEKMIGTNTGLGGALQLLRERNIVQPGDGAEFNADLQQKAAFLAKKRHAEQMMEQEARNQREHDRASGRFDRLSNKDRDDYAQKQNRSRDLKTATQTWDLFNKNYKPNVQLNYVDEHGRSLDRHEAWKHLSHQFHGHGSHKGKTDKLLKKIEDEKRREAQSVLDSSQNVGISSATAQQTKKRKEAGVRLA